MQDRSTKFDRVLILGIGGGAGKIVRHLAGRHPGDWLQLVYVDTDVRDLEFADGVLQLPLGTDWTQGIGCGGDAVLGENLAGNQLQDLRELVQKADLVILVGCLGGGTASGGLQVLGRLLREEDRLGLIFATLPFTVEGNERSDTAREALDALRRHDDVIVAVENEMVFQAVPRETPLPEAINKANQLIAEGVFGLACTVRGRTGIPIDFANLRTFLQERPAACSFATAESAGSRRSSTVIDELLGAPLLGGLDFLKECHVVVCMLYGGPGLPVGEIDECLTALQEQLNPLTRTVLGACTFEDADPEYIHLALLAIQYDRPSDRVDRTSHALVPHSKTMKLMAPGSYAPSAKEVSGVLGIFGNSTPTVRDGENLDIPTFLRRGITLEMIRESVVEVEE
jgi:cell division protein FtsZ